MAEEKELTSFLRDCNDIVKLLTGKSIPNLVKRSAELFGEEAIRGIIKPATPAPDTPYAILGVRPDAATIVVKASYRALTVNLDHDSEEYLKFNEAYLRILSERGEG